MTWIDYAALGVTAISVVWGAWRGLVREVISLGGWVMAFLAANLLAGPLGEALPDSIAGPELRVLLAFAGIFVLTLAVSTLVGVVGQVGFTPGALPGVLGGPSRVAFRGTSLYITRGPEIEIAGGKNS